MKQSTKYAVIGSGCGGHAIAGYLASAGFDVNLYNRSANRIKHLMEHGQIELNGVLNGVGQLSYVGTDISESLKDRDVIMVVTTADAHKDIAKKISPYLRDGQVILLNPGRTCGALEVGYTLKQNDCKADVVVAEANTLVYAVRVNSPGVATIKGVKNEVPAAALRSGNTKYLFGKINSAYPQFIPADSFLETSFSNIGAIFHPTISLLNKERIQRQEDFDFYTDGVTPKVAEFMGKADEEAQNVARALGTKALSVTDWLASRYGLELSDIFTMIRSNPTYQGIKAPKTLDNRYLWEDIPTGLVPISSFGKALGVDTPAIDYLIDEGSDVLNTDFREEGRTPEKMGLSVVNIREDLEKIIAQ